ncbi:MULTISPECIES: ribosome small subunit-dependent GTPase A [unclassified Streptomyces]|uniref:ribosome small subunit-dependent GTPase A n=1 Tax=unclassified Streptomyces TaxID=2593676 RepID=UPI002033B647|nr:MULTISPECIES: ribosome small subunit-dependent GTPase A [unclassified Streptomyces]MCM2422278.1 ribosome small subunit-dependent GTPase A [Streptomyces sp. RKAG293]MCM2425527.1 ribosome small subunit-dependent GTPase A [Streptomyces sp. RKAG337]
MTNGSASLPFTSYGWDSILDTEFTPYADQGLLPGRIVRVDRGLCDVVTPDGTLRADTTFVNSSSDPMKLACTGDWVALDPDAPTGPAVRALLPRRTAFVRSTSSSRSEGQVLAANIDYAVIAVSLAAELDLGRLERFLSLAWESGAQPLVVLTKADVVPDTTHLLADAEGAAPGVQVLVVSAATGEGIEVLAAVLAGSTSVLLGQSGAGKSTLTNALLGQEIQEVQAIRDADGKGRHTTTTRDLLPLPSGGVLIDTPGLRGVGLWDAESGLSQVFSEIEALSADCRFHDCSHVAEPGCAVLAALEDGSLPHRRLESYRKLLRENAWIASRTDQRLRAEMRRDWKMKSAAGRAMYEAKRGGGGGHRRQA